MNVNKASIETLVDLFVDRLEPKLDYLLKHVSIVYIEQQPMGIRAMNMKTKVLSHVLQAMLRSRHMPYEFVSPKLKLNSNAETVSYAANKKTAIRRAEELFDPYGRSLYDDMKAKKMKLDDVCDAFVQGRLSLKSEDDTCLSFDLGIKHLGVWKGNSCTTLELELIDITDGIQVDETPAPPKKRKRQSTKAILHDLSTAISELPVAAVSQSHDSELPAASSRHEATVQQ